MSGEGYESWVEMMIADANLGGQGHAAFHVAMQQAVTSGDASQLEGIASTSGADAATVLCYLHPHYDGKQPGACPSQLDPDPAAWLCCPSDRWVCAGPTMYYRDATSGLRDIKQHTLWVALEAGSGAPRARSLARLGNPDARLLTRPT